jgi:hypothetical protein
MAALVIEQNINNPDDHSDCSEYSYYSDSDSDACVPPAVQSAISDDAVSVRARSSRVCTARSGSSTKGTKSGRYAAGSRKALKFPLRNLFGDPKLKRYQKVVVAHNVHVVPGMISLIEQLAKAMFMSVFGELSCACL